MNPAIEPVASFLQAYAEVAKAKDADTFVGLYAPESLVFDAWDQTEYRGLDAWAGMIRGWFGSLGDESVEVRCEDVQATVGQVVAFASTMVNYEGISAEGKKLRSMTNRLTVGFRKTVNRWDVLHASGQMVFGA